ncbi:hypothetical protein B2A_10368, partial [mine drainage metagenome]
GFEKLAKVEIGYEELQLTDSERRVLDLLGKASRVLDYVFMEQICPAIPPLVEALKSNGGEENRKRLAYLMFNKSPFDALDGLKPFVKGNGICRDIAVYPEGITAEELESAIKNGEISADDAKSYYTAIRRENCMLIAVKYSEAYRARLEQASAIIGDAAEASDNESLKAYLKATATALLTNDYDEQQVL